MINEKAKKNFHEMKNETMKNVHLFLSELDKKCVINGMKEGSRKLWLSSTIEGASLFLIVWSIFLHVDGKSAEWNLYFITAWIAPFIANIVWQELLFEKNKSIIEKQLPDTLMIIASLPTSTPFPKIIQWLSQTTPFPIRKEWKKTFNRIQKGENITHSIQKFASHYPSPLIQKVKHLLIRGYERGCPIQTPASGMASHMLQSQTIVQEKRATLMIEKYTLLLAGGVLVPFILGLMVGVVSELSFNTILFKGESNSTGMLYQTALQAIQGYLFIYSIMGGMFAGIIEGKKWKGSVYVLFLIPGAQIAYAIGQWWAGV